MALGIAHLLNYQLRGRTFFRVAILMPYATSLAAATMIFAELFDRSSASSTGCSPRYTCRRSTGKAPMTVPDRGVVDRDLAVDRLRRTDLPGGDAGDQYRPLRGRGHRRVKEIFSGPAHDGPGSATQRIIFTDAWSRPIGAAPALGSSHSSATTAWPTAVPRTTGPGALDLLMYPQRLGQRRARTRLRRSLDHLHDHRGRGFLDQRTCSPADAERLGRQPQTWRQAPSP